MVNSLEGEKMENLGHGLGKKPVDGSMGMCTYVNAHQILSIHKRTKQPNRHNYLPVENNQPLSSSLFPNAGTMSSRID